MTHVTAQVNLDIYGSSDIAWSSVLEQFEAGMAERFWLATVRPDGRPHLAGVGARWVDGAVYFKSGAATRKSKNLVDRPDCAISAQLPELDVTLEGAAVRVTDHGVVERLARVWAATGWPARACEGALEADYSAPSAGPPPWGLWVMTPRTAVAVGAAGAMSWRFG